MVVGAVLEYASVRLFVERASAVDSTFSATERNAYALVRICRRLDGIPLALELAAARTNVLNAEQIASRLDDRLSLLTGGSRTALPRHRTLRATLDWSYELLGRRERQVFERLSIFAALQQLSSISSR
jgi:non-specific serine/threonine protein kinase